MKDIITHTTDSKAFMAEVEAKFPAYIIWDEATPPLALSVSFDKTPTKRKGFKTQAVVRADAELLAAIKSLATCKILSEVEMYGDLLAAMSKANRIIYDNARDTTPKAVLDEAGNPMFDAQGNALMDVPDELIGRPA